MTPIEDRFWSKVEKADNCWAWSASINGHGYGQFKLDGISRPAHRIAWTLIKGQIPDGLQVDHMCFNRACVNPEHLRLVEQAENIRNRSGLNKNNTSGVRGVWWRKRERRWQAGARLNRKKVSLGTYATIEEAEAVVIEWRRKHMPHSLRDQAPKRGLFSAQEHKEKSNA